MSRLTYQGTNICLITTLIPHTVTEMANSLSQCSSAELQMARRAEGGGEGADTHPGSQLREQGTGLLGLTLKPEPGVGMVKQKHLL